MSEAAVSTHFDRLKHGPFGSGAIDCGPDGGCALVPFTAGCVDDGAVIALLSRWRRENIHGFPKIFTVTDEGTRHWARRLLIERSDRMLFLIRAAAGDLVGHVGLSSFDPAANSCDIDNIVRGDPEAPRGVMTAAVRTMMDWAYTTLRVSSVGLRVMNDNTRALALYHRLGFKPAALEPLREVREGDAVEWVPSGPGERADRFYLLLRHTPT